MKNPTIQPNPKALLVMGCPEIAVQTSLVLYTSHLLSNIGYQVLIAGNNSTLALIRMADPEGHYIKSTADLDATIGDLAQKVFEPSICYVFIHNDAGVTYLATINALISGEAVGVIFGREPKKFVTQCEEADLKCIWAKAVHNPIPLRSKLNREVNRWSASMS
ncbi:MAG: DUF1890 domain-containing protein [Nitrospirae bacterium]|nr:DUF1890 domain-containing protein [Nitrospirota bacterium]